MVTQLQISKVLNTSQTSVNFMLNGKRPVTWPQAVKLSDLFPEKDIRGWKNATPEELKSAFASLPKQAIPIQPNRKEVA